MAQVGTYFPKVRRMVLCFSPVILEHFWPASTLLHGHIALATLSLPETDPQDLEHWVTHRIGFRMSELFRKIDEDFGGSISWNTQPNCREIFNIATVLLSPFFLDLLLGCSSTWRCA